MLRYNHNFQVPEYSINQQKKALPYSIIPIGGKADLIQWRKDQEIKSLARDAYMKPIREATRARVISMVANQNALEVLNPKPEPTPVTAPPTLSEKVKGFFLDILNSAFGE